MVDLTLQIAREAGFTPETRARADLDATVVIGTLLI